MSRRRPTRGASSGDISQESTPLHSDSESESSTLRVKKAKAGPRSSSQLCTDLGIKDVELEWTDADYQNLTHFNFFVRMVRPQLTAVNPRTSPGKLTKILEAKWREFQNSNPFNKKPESKDDDNVSDGGKSSTECEDEDVSRTVGSETGGANNSVSVSPRGDDLSDRSEVEEEDEEEEEDGEEAVKVKPVKAGLRIKLSLKPLRKSARERKVPQKMMMSDKEFDRLLDDSESDSAAERKKRKRRKRESDSEEIPDMSDSESERTSRRKRERKKRRTAADDSADNDYDDDSQQVSDNVDDTDGSYDSDSQRKKKKKSKPMIPGERKSMRSRKGAASMVELTDREFEKLLEEQEKEKEKEKEKSHKKSKHQSFHGKHMRRTRVGGGRDSNGDDKPKSTDPDKSEEKHGDESGNESDHIWYCEICKDGGDLLLCDTCPKSFHKECLKLEIVPDGEWSCPLCTGEGLPEKGDTSEEDDHETFCRVCRDGGDVILCDFCTLVYHMNCLSPPMKNLPDGEWKCPVCVMKENPPKARIKTVLTWRWTHQPKDGDELDHTPKKQTFAKAEDEDSVDSKNGRVQRMKGPERELFVKYEFHSYWDCDWVPELQMEVHQPLCHTYFKRRFYLSEPPALDDGSSFGRPRHKSGVSEDDPHNLEERYYRYGIKPEWMQIQRILAHDGSGKDRRYLVKWRDLAYNECTWEFPEDIPEGLEDWEKHVNDYWTRRKLKMKEERRSEVPKKAVLRKKLEQQPSYLDTTGGKLHPYQLEGLNWLRFSWSQGTNTILADEMGLGKTIQAITFIYGLWKEGYTTKPFLISAPLSTVTNWEREFEFWAPELYVLTYVGGKESRVVIREREFSYREGAFSHTGRPCKMRESHKPKFDVLLTSYEFITMDFATLSSIEWEALIIDEAHRLKNNQSLYFRTLNDYRIKYKLLLTGTPLQNNLEELFNLLNFLEPGKFSEMEEFLNEFSEISKDEQVLKMHDMLAPYMLRRMKIDVLKDIPSKSEFIVRVELSPMQKKYYKHILTKNYEALNAKGYGNQTSLMNIVMDLRKCCNHPYLFPAAEKDAPLTGHGVYEGGAMTKACGKLELLDKMLKILKRDGHRVLIFSQMTRVLDILEDFLTYRGYGYERIDGSIAGNKRQESIDRFNSPESSQFIFLLSTRAGGLGINLASADTVIIYDMDWNPHNDIQAFSRAHRIGQRNKVMIYRFVSRNTVEEKIAQTCKQKMMLSELIVHRGMGGTNISNNEKKESLTKQEINDILKYGAENLFRDDEEGQVVYSDEAIEKLLDRDQEGDVEKEREFGMNEYLRSFKVASYQVKEGVDEQEEEAVEEEKEDESNDAPADDDKDGRKSNETDVQYWQRILGPSYHEHVVQTLKEQEEIAKSLGKGKRIRKQINYAEREMMAEANGAKLKKKPPLEEEAAAQSEYEPTSDSEDSSAAEDENAEESSKKRKAAKTGPVPQKVQQIVLPPLVERIDGQVLVLGFTARQRRAFLDAIMRYGMPPEDPFRSQWLVRDLRAKPERIFKAYVSLFMRHLCEPIADNADKFADGVPREGLSRQHVLTRIGIIALIRKKVHEFEDVNGTDSMAEFRMQARNISANSKIVQILTTNEKAQADNSKDTSGKKDAEMPETVGNESTKEKDVVDKISKDAGDGDKDGTKDDNKSDEVDDNQPSINKDTDGVDGKSSVDKGNGEDGDATKKQHAGDGDHTGDKIDAVKMVQNESPMEVEENGESSKSTSKVAEEKETEPMETDLNVTTEKVADCSDKEKEMIQTDSESKSGQEPCAESTTNSENIIGKDVSQIDKDVVPVSEDGKTSESENKNDDKEKESGEKDKQKNTDDGKNDNGDGKKDDDVVVKPEGEPEKPVSSVTAEKRAAVGRFSAEQLRRVFYIADGGFTELHTLWQMEEQQMEGGKEFETWFRLHDFWLLAGVITHGYRHWQDILSDQRFDLLNQAFKTEAERARKAAFLNRRFQLLEQALVVEEQLRKSYTENPSLIEGKTAETSTASSDKFWPMDELAASLKSLAVAGADARQPKNPKLQKVLTQVIALVNDIVDASYTNMPASLARGYTPSTPKPVTSRPPPPRPVAVGPIGPIMGVMNATGQWSYRPVAQAPRPIVVAPDNHGPLPAATPAAAAAAGASSAEAASSSKVKDVICID